MAKLERKVIGETVVYRGHTIDARFMGGPCLLCYVDGENVGNFYQETDGASAVENAHAAGRRYVDEVEKVSEQARDKAKARGTA